VVAARHSGLAAASRPVADEPPLAVETDRPSTRHSVTIEDRPVVYGHDQFRQLKAPAMEQTDKGQVGHLRISERVDRPSHYS